MVTHLQKMLLHQRLHWMVDKISQMQVHKTIWTLRSGQGVPLKEEPVGSGVFWEISVMNLPVNRREGTSQELA